MANPHKVLGVREGADIKDIKRQYRKLALKHHPDVNKTEGAHHEFLTLTQAYEMLLGKAEGKEDPNHAAKSGWDFHDWYWSFRAQRSWEKQSGPASGASAAAAAGGAGPSGRANRPPQQAGFKQDEAREQLQSQLAGLRHRAAVRANRRAPCAASDQDASPEQEQCEEGEEALQPQAAACGQQPGMDVCDGAFATPVANNAVPFPSSLRGAGSAASAGAAPAGASDQQQQQEQLYAVPDAPDSAADAEEFASPAASQQNGSRRRAFVAGSSSREAVTSQLTGLRRKAAIKAEVASVPA